MKNLSKHAVILDNFSSPYIHQAIIILKNAPISQHDKIIAEAEQIVASYFNNQTPFELCNKQKNTSLKTAVFILSAALLLSLSLLFLR